MAIPGLLFTDGYRARRNTVENQNFPAVLGGEVEDMFLTLELYYYQLKA